MDWTDRFAVGIPAILLAACQTVGYCNNGDGSDRRIVRGDELSGTVRDRGGAPYIQDDAAR